MTRRQLAFNCFTTLVLTACNINPVEVRAPFQGPNVISVQEQPDQYLGAEVRWGGRLLAVENKEEFTEFTIASRRLDQNGRPIPGGYTKSRSKYTGGRFVARVGGFLEPGNFDKGSDITIVGVVRDVEIRDVDDRPYWYPVVAATDYYVWERHGRGYVYPYYGPLVQPYYGAFPYWYGPQYHPYYPGPFYAYPYYR